MVKDSIKLWLVKSQPFFVRSKTKEDFLKRNWLKNSYKIYRLVCTIYKSYSLELFMLESLDRLRIYLADTNFKAEIRNLWMDVFNRSNDNLKYFITKIFFLADIIDQEVAKTIMSFAANTSNNDYRYWTTMDISHVLGSSQKGLYKGFYTDRKELLKQIARDGKFKIERTNTTKKTSNVLVLVVYLMESRMGNSVFRCMKMVAEGMEKYYDQIYILSTDSFYTSTKDIYLTTIYDFLSKLSSSEFAEKCEEFFDDKVKVVGINNDSYKQRYQEFLTTLYSISPTTIIDLTDEFSPVSYFYSEDFTTFYIPLRAGISSSFFSYQLGPKWRLEAMSEKFGEQVDMDKAIEWSFPEYLPQMVECYDRKSMGLEDKSFIIVTAAYISKICSDDFSDTICTLLRNNADMVWLLVADRAPAYIYKNYADLISSKQIIEKNYENNLFALFKLCNIYLRTNVTGGSGSTAIAAMAGLPIVMTTYLCDPMRWLGRDYSNISSLDQLAAEIDKLHKDSTYYENKKQLCRKLVYDATDAEKKWRALSNIIKEVSDFPMS